MRVDSVLRERCAKSLHREEGADGMCLCGVFYVGVHASWCDADTAPEFRCTCKPTSDALADEHRGRR